MSALREHPIQASTEIRNPRTCPRRALKTTRKELLRRLLQLESSLKSAPEIAVDDLDTSIQENTKNLAVAQQIAKHLETVDRALQSADRGQYGICEHCGQPIPPERLLVLPEARLCVRCKNAEEKLARRRVAA